MSKRREIGCQMRRGPIWLVCVFVVAVFSFPAPVMSQRLGRLFSTPEERTLLNELRNNRDLVAPEPEPLQQTTVEEPAVERLTIDGIVIRSGGANSAWVNGRPVSDGWTTREGVRVDAASVGRSGRVKITLPSGVDTIDLKPGQKIDVESGVVVEAYEPLAPSDRTSVFDSATPEPGGAPAVGGGTDSEAPDAPADTPAPVKATTPEEFLQKLQQVLGDG